MFDISDRHSPVAIAEFRNIGGSSAICGRDSLVFVGNALGSLDVISIANPSSPMMVSAFYYPGSPNDIFLKSNYVYIADQTQGLMIMDISDAANPSWVGQYHPDSLSTTNVIVRDSLAYIVAYSLSPWGEIRGIDIVDISDPEAPLMVGRYYVERGVNQIEVDQNYLFAIDGDYNIQILDISNASDPRVIHSIIQPASSHGIWSDGDFAYLANYDSGLQVIDMTSPEAPIVIGNLATNSRARDVMTLGSYAYLQAETDLEIIDISDRSNPALIASYPGHPLGYHILGDYAFIAKWNVGIEIVDISNPQTPILVSVYTPEQRRNAVDVYAQGNYLYVAESGNGFEIVDISDPTQPQQVSRYSEEIYYADHICAQGNYLYTVGLDELRVFDVSDPLNPAPQGRLGSLGWEGLFVEGSYAYIPDIFWGCYIIDISNPAEPVEAGFYRVPAYVNDFHPAGDYVLVGASHSFTVLRFEPTGLDKNTIPIPAQFTMSQNHPNPFNSSTKVTYLLPTRSDVAFEVFDLGGRLMDRVFYGMQPCGRHQLTWEPADLSSGLYFYRIRAGGYSQTRKAILTK